ncbi:MAG: hypothetical protein GY751_04080 [Bacteroidetes bacterium]|nr:hypothetical protein [Bacteroidota bacterium]
MPEERFIKVRRTARVCTYGNLSARTLRIWIVAHGYGQLAGYFLKHFELLNPEKHFIIAPEALSRAYIDGFTGRVGASWMTKDMRKEEIADYINYLDQVVEEMVPAELLKTIPVTAFGFSQGGATISRWVHSTKYNISNMIIWGGDIAEELFSVKTFKKIPIVLAIGDKDVYITPVKRRRLEGRISEKGWTFRIYSYSGGHQLDKHLISRISKDLE